MDGIEFGTAGWRTTLEEFTAPRVRMVGQAVADHLDDEGVAGGVAVGYDAREGSRGFAEELARVLAAAGRDVLVAEEDCPTPATVWAILDRGMAGGLVVTASHNPAEYNGVKFFPADGAPATSAVTDAIEARLAEPDPLPEAGWGTVREADFAGPHAEQCLAVAGDVDLDGLTVVYDAMHGSGRTATPALLERAGADVVRRRCDRDPTFGGSAPEPGPEHLEGLVEAVQEEDADLGLANDGDADRIAVATPDRGFFDENLLFAVMYDHLLEDDAGPAVRSVATTFLVDRVAAAHDESVREVPVGFKWVAEAMAETDALIGGEESGGFAVRGGVPSKDGVLMALLSADAAAEEPLDARADRLLAEHGEIHQDKLSVDCPDDQKEAVLESLAADVPDAVAGTDVESVNDADGVKLLLADGAWLLVRPSGTEPKMRVYAEAGSPERVAELLAAGREMVEPLVE